MEDEGGDYQRVGTYARWPSVPHYYGDIVRQLFVIAGVLILLAAPFYADTLADELPFEIAAVLALIVLGSLADPHNKLMLIADAVAAGVGLVIYQHWALNAYAASTWMQFILREMLAVIFLLAFYFSLKTVRAFTLHKIGKHDEVGEFDEESIPDEPVRTARVSDVVASANRFLPWSGKKAKTKKISDEKNIKLNCEIEEEEEDDDDDDGAEETESEGVVV